MKSQVNRRPRRQDANPVVEWFKDCKDEEEKKSLTEYLRNSTPLFDQLKEMLQRRFDGADSVREKNYDSAGWAYKQAHWNGYKDALQEVYKLLP